MLIQVDIPGADEGQLFVDISGNTIRLYDDVTNFMDTEGIHFCPMCGRKLDRTYDMERPDDDSR